MAYLIVLRGPNAGSRTRLVGDQARIGSDPHNDLVLNDPSVSPRHAVVRRGSGGRFVIEDQETMAGTRVNGQTVVSGVLSDGATITIGRAITLRFLDAGGGRAAEKPESRREQISARRDEPPAEPAPAAAMPMPDFASSGPGLLGGALRRRRRPTSEMFSSPETESHAVLDATNQALDSYQTPSRTKWRLIALAVCLSILAAGVVFRFACE